MARSHHRKKHKEHLRQFRHKEQTTTATPKTRASGIFAIGGAVVGLAVSYFATAGSWIWVLAGAIAGAVAGYFIGRKVDAE